MSLDYPQTVLFGEPNASGELLFLSLVHRGPVAERPLLLPLALVEDFIAFMKSDLGEPGTRE